MTTRINYAVCAMFVEGLDMPCPLCGVMVLSGNRHECKKPDKPSVKLTKSKPVRRQVPDRALPVRRGHVGESDSPTKREG